MRAAAVPVAILLVLAGWSTCEENLDPPDHVHNPSFGDTSIDESTAEAPAGEESTEEAPAEAEAETPHCEEHAELEAGEPVEGASLYQLDLPITDQHGAEREVGDLEGTPVVIAMIYTSCATACPMILQEVEKIVAEADAAADGGKADLLVLLLSMDPDRDSPEALKAWADFHELDERYVLARAEEAKVREYAAVLGTRYRQLPSGDFNHSPVIAVLDAQGALAGRMEGFGEQRGDLVERLRVLLR